jgi:small subunit ribosomal protein S9
MSEEKKTTKAKAKKPAAPKKKAVKAAPKAEPKAVAPIVEVKAPEPVVAAPVEHKPVEHKPVHHHKPKKEKVAKITFYGTGRRKRATAKVWLTPGSGKITVNQKPFDHYFFGRQILLQTVQMPFVLTETGSAYDVSAKVLGGGNPSQADAMRMGIARALIVANPELRKILRSSDMLRRDPREKERKKYGLKRARRGFQYSKR